MSDIDQSRFDNRCEDSNDAVLLSAAEAAARLGVKPATLYTYVSRGLLSSVPDPTSRRKRYPRSEVERLRSRARARSGHGPVAAGALRWGEPILDTKIGSIEIDGPWYRGRSAVALARGGRTLPEIAEILWDGSEPWSLHADDDAEALRDELAGLVPEGTPPLDRLAVALPLIAAHDPGRFNAPLDAELRRSRRLVPTLAMLLGVDDALLDSKLAPAVHCAAVLSADHGLNASTFAARVVASTGADLYACLSAGVAALSGPRHGGACERIEAFLEVADRVGAERAVHDRLRRGETVPGFHHPLYPRGDPRTAPLLEIAHATASSQLLDVVDRVAAAMQEAGHDPPTLDFGLVAVARALALGAGGSTALFALGRCVGWIAHVLEQRTLPGVLRPRARYIGVRGGEE